MAESQPILYDPGIPGFVKGHRHPSGASLIMTTWDEDDVDWISVYWVKRLHFAARPVENHKAWSFSCSSLKATERAYELLLSLGPPPEAIIDFQRRRVYTWEDEAIMAGYEPLTWDECQTYVRFIWEKVGKRRRKPDLINSLKIQQPMAFEHTIHLPGATNADWTKPVLLHEIAHILKFEYQHGPKWVAQYMDLCVKFLDKDRRSLQESADKFGVLYR